jgi:hypothetical protein
VVTSQIMLLIAAVTKGRYLSTSWSRIQREREEVGEWPRGGRRDRQNMVGLQHCHGLLLCLLGPDQPLQAQARALSLSPVLSSSTPCAPSLSLPLRVYVYTPTDLASGADGENCEGGNQDLRLV